MVTRRDPQSGNQDIWVFQVASGKSTPVTNDAASDMSPIWSPDGRQVAYVSGRGPFASIFRKSWDGTGSEEQLFQFTPGAGGWLTDWSADGRFLAFEDDCSTILYVLPLRNDQKALERKAMEWLRDEYSAYGASFSPDSRFMAYQSNESKTTEEIRNHITEVYVRPFDPDQADVSSGGEKPIQVSPAGALGMIFWRQDGRELYYLTPDWEVMAVDVTTTPTFQTGTPRLLFKPPGPPAGRGNFSRDGQRVVFTINVPASIFTR